MIQRRYQPIDFWIASKRLKELKRRTLNGDLDHAFKEKSIPLFDKHKDNKFLQEKCKMTKICYNA